MYQQLSVNYVDGCSCVYCFRFHHHRHYWLVMHFFKRYVALAEFTHKVIITCEKFIIIFVYILFFLKSNFKWPFANQLNIVESFQYQQIRGKCLQNVFRCRFLFCFMFEYRYVALSKTKRFIEQWQQIQLLLHSLNDIFGILWAVNQWIFCAYTYICYYDEVHCIHLI